MENSVNRWQFVAIEKRHQKDNFDCGYRVLNDYLKKYARQNHQKGIAKTFVAIPANEDKLTLFCHSPKTFVISKFCNPCLLSDCFVIY
jgi:hypothetical protein